jgi:hypothetical protein
MSRRAGFATSPFRAIAAATALLAAGSAIAEDGSQRHSVVACMSEGGSPWVRKAQGTLMVMKSGRERTYRWEFGEQSYASSMLSNDDGSTSISGPGLLIGRLVKLPDAEEVKFPRGPTNAAGTSSDRYPRGQKFSVTGEIREYAGPIFLAVVIGSKCPPNL